MSSVSLDGRKRPIKRLLFDRRYGWIFDEWKDPAEEALAGGRGMFCILPLAKALVKAASQSIDFAASSIIMVLEKPDDFSPESLLANFNHQVLEVKTKVDNQLRALNTALQNSHNFFSLTSSVDHDSQNR